MQILSCRSSEKKWPLFQNELLLIRWSLRSRAHHVRKSCRMAHKCTRSRLTTVATFLRGPQLAVPWIGSATCHHRCSRGVRITILSVFKGLLMPIVAAISHLQDRTRHDERNPRVHNNKP
nr:hypothetical protein CFP56_78876 [Quercus suber]